MSQEARSAARGRSEHAYVVREELRVWTEYEVTATSKAAAIEKAKDGAWSHTYAGDPFPTGRWEAQRV